MLTKIVFSILALALLGSGCSTKDEAIKPAHKQTKNMGKMMMFQSVPADKATILQDGKNKLYCVNCGMTLPMFYKTNHAATHGGNTNQYCSIHCLALDKEVKKLELKDIKVVDTNSLKFIDAKSAYYVVGSSKKGTMTMVSKYAFASKTKAQEFVNANGGEVMSFKQALEVAKKDFSQAMMEKMKAKKALMAEKGSKIYAKKCKQTTLPKFSSVADAKAYIKENNLCGDLKGKPLQALGIYFFTKK